MEYSIRFATKSDTNAIMEYIDEFWRKGHILARNRELFEWQYGGDTKLNIVLGIGEDKRIYGMLGFIPYGTSEKKDIALALWKAEPGTGFLGVRLLRFLMENEPHREIVCPGINMQTTSKIYEYVGMSVDKMVQWYRLADRSSYLIAKVADREIPPYKNTADQMGLIEVDSVEELRKLGVDHSETSKIPNKTEKYIEKRYFEHPIYQYQVYAIDENKNGTENKNRTIIVLRIQECNGARALRLIDCIGDPNRILNITEALDKLMDELVCEYIDTYEAGMDEDVFWNAGWRKVEEEGNIIPDYFSPFEHRKVDIYYSTSNKRAVLFKGDGDQDRPN